MIASGPVSKQGRILTPTRHLVAYECKVIVHDLNHRGNCMDCIALFREYEAQNQKGAHCLPGDMDYDSSTGLLFQLVPQTHPEKGAFFMNHIRSQSTVNTS